MLIDSAISDAGKPYYQAFLSTDNEGGRALREGADRPRRAVGQDRDHVVRAGRGVEVSRVGGFRKYIESHSKLQVVGPYYSQSQMATALNQTTDVLSANPDLKGIFGANEPTAVGMGRALKQSGKAGKVVAIGFDGNEDLQGFVRDGTVQAIAVRGSWQMGNQGVRTALDVIERKPAPKLIDTGVVMVDKQNLDSQAAKNVLY